MKKSFVLLAAIIFSGSLPAEEQPNVKTTTENYKDWQIACVEQGEIKRCEMKQTLVNQERKPVSVLSLVKKNEKQLLMQIALPHLLDLSVPVQLDVDDKKVAALPFKFCNQVACFVIVDENESVFAAFKKGSAGLISTQAINGEKVKLNFSLSGFSAAVNSLPLNK